MSILQDISQISVIFDEIQQNLPDASPEQVQRFTAQVKNYIKLRIILRITLRISLIFKLV